jgi:hypothetical protein
MGYRKLGFFVAGCALGTLSLLSGCASTSTLESQAPAITASPSAQPPESEAPERSPDVPYVPTPEVVVNEMLSLAKVGPEDVLYDLGSGDGRIPITAAQKFGTRGVGIDINPQRVQEANENAKKAGVTDQVKFRQQDLFESDFSEATVVTLYLLPDINLKLRPQLFEQLKPGTRVVSHDFDMGDWKPEQVVEVKGPTRTHTLYYWRIPDQVPPNLRQPVE